MAILTTDGEELPALHGGEHFSNHRDRSGADKHDKNAREYEEHQGKNQLYRGFRCFLFRNLAAARPHRIALHSQGLGDAGAEFIGLNQNGRERFEVVDASASA
jgi:hypothetical protein